MGCFGQDCEEARSSFHADPDHRHVTGAARAVKVLVVSVLWGADGADDAAGDVVVVAVVYGGVIVVDSYVIYVVLIFFQHLPFYLVFSKHNGILLCVHSFVHSFV